MEFHQRIEAVNPNLKTFFCGKKAIVECGIYAMLNLVSQEKSGNTATLADEKKKPLLHNFQNIADFLNLTPI
jgi:hypothetical protein